MDGTAAGGTEAVDDVIQGGVVVGAEREDAGTGDGCYGLDATFALEQVPLDAQPERVAAARLARRVHVAV